ncbi:polyphosphate polymerase domain-containing protein [Catenuloplanes japonicus]|uniref:polyphosphate polymerase domain-containing protein n=1 Tax=Catenuloplanes japonicus TaxID=33876 RepID=UPI000525A449|nr:polyphosphate polymerase domain-containing protein [Catenuloplanes japonicus]
MRPISLDELVARAALLHRVDRKYILPAACLPRFLDGLGADTGVLEIDGLRTFHYRSDYLDTPALASYLGAARRRRHRFKIRFRRYEESGARFIEVKTRGRRGGTVKQRTPHDAPALTGTGLAYVTSVLSDAGITAAGLHLEPVLTTRYRRTTLFLPGSGARVTIDEGLTWERPDGDTRHVPDSVVVETKSPAGASEADRLLWSLGRRPAPVSKYATGMAALHPGLPANRWLPVLRSLAPTPKGARS